MELCSSITQSIKLQKKDLGQKVSRNKARYFMSGWFSTRLLQLQGWEGWEGGKEKGRKKRVKGRIPKKILLPVSIADWLLSNLSDYLCLSQYWSCSYSQTLAPCEVIFHSCEFGHLWAHVLYHVYTVWSKWDLISLYGKHECEHSGIAWSRPLGDLF